MQITDKRGWGAASAKNKPDKIVPRYGVSPQLAPPRTTPSERQCFAEPIVSAPQTVK